MRFLPYNKNNKMHARDLRNNATKGEVLLWNALKARKIKGYQFNRQKPLDNYIADFYCKKLGLVIEIDGGSHAFAEVAVRDEAKQNAFERMGLTVIRFREAEVVFHRAQVIQAIYDQVENMEREKE